MPETLTPVIFSAERANCILLVDSRFPERTGNRECVDIGMEWQDAVEMACEYRWLRTVLYVRPKARDPLTGWVPRQGAHRRFPEHAVGRTQNIKKIRIY